jgi:hypothetical protein
VKWRRRRHRLLRVSRRREHDLSVSILDTEDASCSTAGYPIFCGEESVELYDATGDDQGGPGWSMPTDGISVPATWSTVISTAGTYYLEVSGDEGLDDNGNPTRIPYQLSVSATPNVVWPPPPPILTPTKNPPSTVCTVPHYRGATLSMMRTRLGAANCQVGPVRRVFDRHVRARYIIKLSETPGARLPDNATVGITVSKGKRRRH